MSETCPKCGAELHAMHEPDGSKDCLRTQLTAAQARIAELERKNEIIFIVLSERIMK